VSGFDSYRDELATLDREILHYAALCGVDISDHAAIHACLHQHHDDWPSDKPRETLRGLLVLRMKIEEEILQAGMRPPELGGW